MIPPLVRPSLSWHCGFYRAGFSRPPSVSPVRVVAPAHTSLSAPLSIMALSRLPCSSFLSYSGFPLACARPFPSRLPFCVPFSGRLASASCRSAFVFLSGSRWTPRPAFSRLVCYHPPLLVHALPVAPLSSLYVPCPFPPSLFRPVAWPLVAGCCLFLLFLSFYLSFPPFRSLCLILTWLCFSQFPTTCLSFSVACLFFF